MSSNTKGGKAGTTLSNMSDGNELNELKELELGDARPQALEELVRRRLHEEGGVGATAEILGKGSGPGQRETACTEDG